MSETFSIKPLPQILFGAGRLKELPATMSKYGNTALLLTGDSSFARTTHWSILQESLASTDIHVFLEKISEEPTPEIIDSLVKKYHLGGVEVVIAIGGGSVLDSGKAVAAMLPEGQPVTQFLEVVGDSPPDGRKTPFIAVPTTSGTGSEVTSNAVIRRTGENGFKKSLRHQNYIPDIAIIDPLLTLECPQRLTIHCAMDAFTQLVESYLSVKASAYTDDLILGAIHKIRQSLLPVCHGGGEIDDRSNMSYAALISGISLDNAGLGVIHGFASVIGGLFQIPHGVVCGTLMATTNEVTLKKLRRLDMDSVALAKYASLGRIFSDKTEMSIDYYQDFFVDELKRFTQELQIDLLSQHGITNADVETITRLTDSKNNPVELTRNELQEILIERIS